MIYALLDGVLNMVVPLLCLIAPGIYVYRSGKFVRGALLTWALLFGYEVASLLIGGVVFGHAPRYSGLFEQGPGVMAMLIMGWFPGLVVSLVSMLIRYIVCHLGKRKGSETGL